MKHLHCRDKTRQLFLVVVFFFSVFSDFSVAQSVIRIDSLYKTILKLPDDTAKVSKYANLLQQCMDYKNDSLKNVISNQGILLAKKLNFKKGLMVLYYIIQGNEKETGKADEYIHLTFELAKELNDSQYIAACYAAFGTKAWQEGRSSEALEFYLKSKAISEKMGMDGYTIYRYLDISRVYIKQKNWTDEKYNLDIALQLSLKNNDSSAILNCYDALAGYYHEIKKSDSSLFYMFKGLAIARQLKEEGTVANLLSHLASTYTTLNNFSAADSCFRLSLQYYKKGFGSKRAGIYSAWANMLNKQGKYNEALEKLKLEEQVLDSNPSLAKTRLYSGLALTFENLGMFKEATGYYKELIQAKDSINEDETRKELRKFEAQYKTNEKEKEIELLSAQQTIKDAEIKKQMLIRNFSIAAIALVVCISIILFNRQQLKRKTEKLAAELNRQKEIEKERLRIGAELHDDVGSSLTKISLMSQVAGTMAGDKQQTTLRKITHESSDMVDKMNGIIWALNTKNDSLPNLLSFIRKHAFEMFEDSAIKLMWQSPDEIPEVAITGEVRRNIYLVTKEALHNALKYSSAQAVEIKIDLNEDKLSIMIADNGKGFEASPPAPLQKRGEKGGNGLQNMQKRMDEIGGQFKILSEKDKGTRVVINYLLERYTKV